MTPGEKVEHLLKIYDRILDNNLHNCQECCEVAGFLKEIAFEMQEFSDSASLRAAHLQSLATSIVEGDLDSAALRVQAQDLLDDVIMEVQDFYGI